MTYEITDEFLDKVDVLLDSVMEASKNFFTLDGAGVVLVSLEKFENMKQLASELCDAMEDGFPEYGKDEEDEEDAEECTNPGDDDPVAVFDNPDGFGCAPDAD
ncbi:MAG: hypothetical protein LKE88_00580 [Acidaminococcus provencensis]|uniref:hypothetical protein n=1 Tax=Acidaminococcus provencensis TaxID=2058289 RepID=UPI0023F551DF|nr:hypothetical protein [Acidaminococcus provencensis]MCH4095135.1 hypothetical protein [Acidaminococcus provencensis]